MSYDVLNLLVFQERSREERPQVRLPQDDDRVEGPDRRRGVDAGTWRGGGGRGSRDGRRIIISCAPTTTKKYDAEMN